MVGRQNFPEQLLQLNVPSSYIQTIHERNRATVESIKQWAKSLDEINMNLVSIPYSSKQEGEMLNLNSAIDHFKTRGECKEF